MKRTAAFLLLLTLLVSASVTSLAQGSRPGRLPSVTSDFVRFQEIRSYTEGQGVYIGWQMVQETNNIGFFIYRMTAGGAQLVNPTIVGGFATKLRVPTGYGEKYEFYDPDGVIGSTYYIESLNTDARRISTPSFQAKFTNDLERDTGHPKAYWEELSQNRNGDIQKRDMRLPKALQAVVNEAMMPPDLNAQRWVANQPGAKIAVKQEGLYRVTRTELQNAGFNVNTNSAHWRLYMEGNEQAIIVGAGDQYIEFYGRGRDTAESDTRIYYLIAHDTPGKRVESRILNPLGGNVVTNSYTATAVRSERFEYRASILNGEEQNYFGTFIDNSPDTVPNPGLPNYVPYTLTGIDFNVPTASMRVRLQGFDRVAAHMVQVAINGHNVGFVTGTAYESMVADFTFPTSHLVEGPNFLTFTGSGGSDFTFFDTVTINYPRQYLAEQNRVGFFTPGYRKANVTGFTSANIRVFDTTYDSNMQMLENFQIVNNAGTFTAVLPSDRSAVMYAVDDSALLQSPSITFNNPSALSTSTTPIDVLIISYSAADFISAAQSWATYRRSPQGGAMSVIVIDVADLYDEYTYGTPSSNAISDFLAYAKISWPDPGPRYTLLLGDASHDPRNYQGQGNWNLVPVKMVDLVFGESGSDEALPDFDLNGTANIPIGRIPARSAANITGALAKVTGFETPAMQNMGRGAVCAFDLPQGFDFQSMCEILMSEVPPGTPVTYVSRGLPPPNQHLQDPQAHANLMAALNAGPYIVNYAGHGSAGLWASASFFGLADVPALSNGPNQSIYTMLTCLNGYFIRPVDDSLAEALLKAPNGGAVATWASSTDTTPNFQMLMAQRFYDQISIGNIKRMGDLIKDAKAVLPPSTDVGYSWVLFGDPALKVRQ